MTELFLGILIPNADYGEDNPPGLHDGLFRCRADDGVLNAYFYGALVLVLADSDAESVLTVSIPECGTGSP